MTDEESTHIRTCIANDNVHAFYNWGPWVRKRQEVLRMDKGECQMCKAKKIYTKANTVHHVCYVRKYPHLALDIWYTESGERKRNLISLCHSCHEEIHNHRKKKQKLMTEERW